MTLPGKPASLWIESAPDGELGAQPFEDVTVDVAVLGAGIVGISVADMLKREGKTVAVVEAKEVLRGATGYTTAKVTSQHGSKYRSLVDAWGEEAARVYGSANEAAIEKISETAAERGIDCDFERKAAYVFTESDEEVEDVRAEAEAAARVGLPSKFVTETSLPFRVAGAVRFDNQAQFHPRKYLLPLARGLAGDGSYLFEHTRATDVRHGDPCTVSTTAGTIRARHVVVATHLPFLDRGLFFAKTHPERSYVVAGLSNTVPDGMFISFSSPTRSIRTAREGEDTLLLVSGEGHKVGQEPDTEARYKALEDYGRDRLGLSEFRYRWSTQDNMSTDGIPFVGRVHPGAENVLVATGFGKWGMTNGVVAALILLDHILGRTNPWAEVFDAARLWRPFTSRDLYKENVNAGAYWFGDRLKGAEAASVEDVPVGEGAIVRVGGRKTAVYRDETTVHAMSPVCTHLACIVNWNSVEKSWDCPCHGSRFDARGKVIQGPAIKDLEERSL